MNLMKTAEYRENLAKMFINCLQEKELDWKKEWKTNNSQIPRNAVTGKRYRGINYFALGMTAMEKGYDDPRWATFKQIQNNGWKLQKGSKATIIEYWFPYDYENKKALTWEEARNRIKEKGTSEKIGLTARYYSVFNAKQIDGIPALPQIEKNINISQDELIDKLSGNMGVEILYDGGDRAFYRPSEDKIHLPQKEYFASTYAYNATVLHELAHATGAPDRLNRKQGNYFGTPEYAYEELVAEISSCFMASELSIDQENVNLDNHKAYVQSWISCIQEKPENLIKAIKDATECADYMSYKAELIPEEEYLKTRDSARTENLQVEKNVVTKNQIVEDIKRSGFKPSRALVENIEKTGGLSLAEISNMKKCNEIPDEIRDSVLAIVNECKTQELSIIP